MIPPTWANALQVLFLGDFSWSYKSRYVSHPEETFEEKGSLGERLDNECVSEFSSFEIAAKTDKKLLRGLNLGAYVKKVSLESE